MSAAIETDHIKIKGEKRNQALPLLDTLKASLKFKARKRENKSTPQIRKEKKYNKTIFLLVS